MSKEYDGRGSFEDSTNKGKAVRGAKQLSRNKICFDAQFIPFGAKLQTSYLAFINIRNMRTKL